TERGLRKYTSFNAWAVRALLQDAISRNDNSTFNTQGLEALNFVMNHLQNSTNHGLYHWVLQNGSLPDKSHWTFNNSVYQIGTYQAWMILAMIEVYNFTLNTTLLDWSKEIANFLITYLWDSKTFDFQ
ncbi:unnamed protein product, partial [marine sediment metagenome]